LIGMMKLWQRWLREGYGWLRSQDLIVLLLMLVVVLGVWGFIELADEVVEGDTRTIDEWVLRALRTPADAADPIGPPWLEDAVRDVTALGGGAVLVLVIVAVIGFVAMQRQYHALWLFIAAVAGGVLLNVLLKQSFDRPRPELVPRLLRVESASFPSGHSLLSAVVYLTLGALLTRLVRGTKARLYIVTTALLLSFIVGVSRVYLGVHYPTDVLAGWTVGLVWAVLCWLVADYLQRRGLVEKARSTSADEP
jgi:undecaprenyl-diphosphatase